MRRLLAFLLLIVFAVASEGAALCSTQPMADTHGCCGRQPVSSASLQTCCAASQPDRDTIPITPQATASPLTCLAAAIAVDRLDTRTAAAYDSPLSSYSSVPLYLQHGTLLI
jgi:hypothetical protein